MGKRGLRDANKADTPKPAILPLFAYGTIMAGEMLHWWVKDILVQPPTTAICTGTSLWTQTEGDYPYLVKSLNGADKVIGELMIVRNDGAFARLAKMEVGAGYTLATVPLVTNQHDRIHALTFLWTKPTSLYGLVPLGAESWRDKPDSFAGNGGHLRPVFSQGEVPGWM